MILLDTHIWIRWIESDTDPLPIDVSRMIDHGERVSVSAISCWEVSYLVKRNRLSLPLPIDEWIQAALDESGVESLSLTAKIASRATMLPDIHRDPADRFIIATAIETGATLLTLDGTFKDYPELGKLLHKRENLGQ
jgi:PIN domain nuclease of toxin-antitoxin system